MHFFLGKGRRVIYQLNLNIRAPKHGDAYKKKYQWVDSKEVI
jgi:hypothetical protein